LLSKRRPGAEACDAQRLLASEVDARVWRAVRNALETGDALQHAADEYLDKIERRIEASNPEVARTHAELEALRAERQRNIDVEARYGTDRTAEIAVLDRRIAELDEALRERSRETAQLDRLREERGRVRTAIAKYDGAFTVGADELPEDDDGSVRLWFHRDNEPDDRTEGGRMVGLRWFFRGVNVRRRTEIVDALDLVVTAYDDRLEVEGAVRAVLPVSPLLRKRRRALRPRVPHVEECRRRRRVLAVVRQPVPHDLNVW
jgi:hypothetical protein